MNLVFDLDREEGDQLVAQYSLIPTPLSVWGRPAGGRKLGSVTLTAPHSSVQAAKELGAAHRLTGQTCECARQGQLLA